jgi:predicted DCC family thiol-disulfide oxidoreductase YuxK
MRNPTSVSGAVLTVYYDGACYLCSREMEHYRKKDKDRKLRLVDIAAAGFDVAAEGLDPVQINRVMHVRTLDGRLHTALDAFIQIWKTVPGYTPLANLASLPWIRPLFEVGYHSFARIRPYLPRRKSEDCKRCQP